MMIPSLSTHLVRYTPPHRQGGGGEKPEPVYLLKPADVFERALYESDMDRFGCRFHADTEMFEEARAALKASGGDVAPLFDLVDQVQMNPDSLDDDMRRRWERLERSLVEDWPAYREMVAMRSRYVRLMPLCAARRFLKGWENGPCEFRMGPDGMVPNEMLNLIPPADLLAIGTELRRMMYLRPEEEKNLSAPSSSEPDRRILPEGGKAQAAKGGSSTQGRARKSSKKIRD
ncbi:hypothetical protein [Iodidimonas gelatinilytica]|nr:hypothetical protein [Iodidimonas gelatinilytica]